MKQIGVLAAGCQIDNKHVLFANEDVIYYASTLSIYIYSVRTFLLERVVNVSPRTIAGFSVAKDDHHKIIVVAVDGTLSVWKLNEEKLLARAMPSSPASSTCSFLCLWDPHQANSCIVITSDSTVKISQFDCVTANTVELITIRKWSSVTITCAQFNPHPGSSGRLACGSSAGKVFLFNIRERTQKILEVSERTTPVVDIQWDKLSSVYLLVAYSSFCSLWDSETMSELVKFDKQTSIPISSIAWLDWTAGNFITANAKTGHVRVWNASQSAPLTTFRVSNVGIHALTVSASTQSLVCTGTDGSLSSFSLSRMASEYVGNAGHTNTIFECAFCPTSPELFCTASADGSVKVWNVSNLTLVRTLTADRDMRYYCCSWSLLGKKIAASTDSGAVVVWDANTGAELCRSDFHSKPAYAVQWNHHYENTLCSTSVDGSVVVWCLESGVDDTGSNESVHSTLGNAGTFYENNRTPTKPVKFKSDRMGAMEIVVRMRHSNGSPVYNCSWNPHYGHILAVAGHDSKVRIFNYTLSKPLLFVLSGHSAKVFNLAWSFLCKGLLASSSDDQLILVWKVDVESISSSSDLAVKPPSSITTPLVQLIGHTANARGIAFSSEHKQILISGGWDATIRIWDMVTGSCVAVVSDHVADVYSICVHPDRPFTVLSCSRDTTVRIWSMDGFANIVRMTAALDCSLDRLVFPDDNESSVMKQLGYRSTVEDTTPGSVAEVPDSPKPSSSLFHSSIQSSSSSNHSHSNSNASVSVTGSASLGSGASSRSIGVVASTTRYGPQLHELKPALCGQRSTSLHYWLRTRSQPTVSESDKSIDDSPVSSSPNPSARSPMVSDIERRLQTIHNDPLMAAQKYYKIYSFLSGANGCLDLWEAVIRHLMKTPKIGTENTLTISLRNKSQRYVIFEDDLTAEESPSGAPPSSAAAGSTPLRGSKRQSLDDQLRTRAQQLAKAGDISGYCKVLIEMGDWESALAYAPAVSMEYWQELCGQYAKFLSSPQADSLSTGPSSSATTSAGFTVTSNALRSGQTRMSSTGASAGLSSSGSMLLNNPERSVPYLLASGLISDAVEFFVRKRDPDSALVVAKMVKPLIVPKSSGSNGMRKRSSSTHSLGNGRTTSNDEDVIAEGLDAVGIDIGFDDDDDYASLTTMPGEIQADFGDNSLASIMHAQALAIGGGGALLSAAVTAYIADLWLDASRPILAAAQYLASGSVVCAMEVLSAAGEFDLAFSVGAVMDCLSERVLFGLAEQFAAEKGGLTLGLEVLDIVTDSEIQKGLLISRYCQSDSAARVLASKHGVRPAPYWQSKAQEMEAAGEFDDAIAALIISRDFSRAAALGIAVLRRYVRDPSPSGLTESALRTFALMKKIQALELEPSARNTFLCYMLWFGAHEAIAKRLWQIGSAMLKLLTEIPATTKTSFPIAAEDIRYHSLLVLIGSGNSEAIEILSVLASQTNLPAEVVDSVRTLRALLWLSADSKTPKQSQSQPNPVEAGPQDGQKTIDDLIYQPRHIPPFRGLANKSKTVLLWGSNTPTIVRECQKLSSALSLPSLSSMYDSLTMPGTTRLPTTTRTDSTAGLNSRLSSSVGAGALDDGFAVAQPAVLEGSFLPASNVHQSLKKTSFVSKQRILGAEIVIREEGGDMYNSNRGLTGTGEMVMSVNELWQWKSILPYSPTLTGEFIE